MEEYIRRQHNTVAQYIAKQSLLDLCEWVERALGVRVGMWWCEQMDINMMGAREAAAAVEAEEGGV